MSVQILADVFTSLKSDAPHTVPVSDDAPLQVRSHRHAQWFWVDNAVLDTYGPTLGPIGLALYMGLCRYANSTTGKCWPSLGKLSAQIGISVISASRHIKALVACGLIHIEQRPGTTALITILDIPESPITEIGVPADPHPPEGTPPSQSLGGPSSVMGEPSLVNQTKEPDPPNPPEEAYTPREENPLDQPTSLPTRTTRPDNALLALGLDEATRTQLYDQARATLVAEGVSPWHLIQPAIECRMLAIWEVQPLTPGGSLDPQPGQAEVGGWHQGRAA